MFFCGFLKLHDPTIFFRIISHALGTCICAYVASSCFPLLPFDPDLNPFPLFTHRPPPPPVIPLTLSNVPSKRSVAFQ